MVKLVTVVTPTCSRTDILLRAARSVVGQDYSRVEHVIVGDRHPRLDELTPQLLSINPQAKIVNLDIPAEVVYPTQRASVARNFGISLASGDYIAHLDDDNEIVPEHISSLVEVAEREASPAAHSWRQLFTFEGVPFKVERYPWKVSPFIAAHVYREFVRAGIFIPGTNEVRDQMVTPWSDPILHVDTSEWLISRELHERTKFPTDYTLRQMIQNQTEDFLLAAAFHQQGIRVACSERATLRYYLGGYSNESA